jgi:two-component system, OmpR family, sensor histidine kinase MtrB
VLRRSLQARAVLFTLMLSTVALVTVGGFLSYSIGAGLFNTRVNQIMGEASRAAADVQNTFASSSVANQSGLQTLMNQVVPNLETSATSQSRRVALIRTPGQGTTTALQSPVSADLDLALIPDDLRSAVQNADGKLNYKSVTLPQPDGSSHPGLVVGAPIVIPVAGAYELYLVYDLQSEQDTLDFVQRTLVFGGLSSMILIALVSLFVTNWLVRPVLLVAQVSEKIAAGDLGKRIPERGQDVIAQLSHSFNRMADDLEKQIQRLKQLSTMQQRFVSDVSHEMKTPLAVIKLSLGRLSESKDTFDDPTKNVVDRLERQVQKFETLLSGLLEMSRFDAGVAKLDLSLKDLREVAGEALVGVQPLADQSGCKLLIDLQEADCEAEIDARRIERIVRNLLTNAIIHSGSKEILVAVASDAKAVAVSVTDFGVGMNAEQTQHVFDRFYRADPSRTKDGTGLGMAIANEDTSLHEGKLELWSEPGVGTSFRLTLPRAVGKEFKRSPLPLPPSKLSKRGETKE